MSNLHTDEAMMDKVDRARALLAAYRRWLRLAPEDSGNPMHVAQRSACKHRVAVALDALGMTDDERREVAESEYGPVAVFLDPPYTNSAALEKFDAEYDVETCAEAARTDKWIADTLFGEYAV